MSVSSDRWSCPHCETTIVIHGSQRDTHAAIAAAQKRHGKEHRKAAEADARMRASETYETQPNYGTA